MNERNGKGKIKDKGISMGKNWDFVWELITEHVAKAFLVSSDVIEKRMEKERRRFIRQLIFFSAQISGGLHGEKHKSKNTVTMPQSRQGHWHTASAG